MREMSVTEQRYKADLAVMGDGRTVGEVARDWRISRRTMHRWLVRYEGDGLEGLIPNGDEHSFIGDRGRRRITRITHSRNQEDTGGHRKAESPPRGRTLGP